MPTIHVAGDLIGETTLGRLPAAPSSYADPLPSAAIRRLAGGAWHLAELVAVACGDLPDVTVQEPTRDEALIAAGDPHIARAISLWSPHPRTSGSRERVWRIEQFLGSQPPLPKATAPDAPLPHPLALLVLADENLGFRHEPGRWSALLRASRETTAIVLQTVAPLGEGPLWEELIAQHAHRLTIVLTARALRARHATISQALSWDRTIEELDRELTAGASVNDLARARRVVVSFTGAGAAIYGRDATGRPALERFLYHPDDLEGAWQARRPGLTVDATGILTAALVRHALAPASYPLFVAAGRALAAMRAGHEIGGGLVHEGGTEASLASFAPGGATDRLAAILHPATETPPQALPEAAFRAAFPRALLAVPSSEPPASSASDLLRDVTGPGYEYVATTALQVVLHGVERTLDAAPKARYGAFLTVDREEIERVNEIRRLMLTYQASPADRRPLSLAVFGPPGSGKSFAIKQLAADLFGGRQAVLEFNLSQLAGRDDLHEAFNQVRDASVRGQIPLVFWDEFDTGGLSWLKEFLAPMQDAEFRAGGIAHPFAKVIFIFAGGTAADFQSFDQSAAASGAAEGFRLAKGPDFVSRLRGYLNIKGPNPIVRGRRGQPLPPGETDVAHLIRRAILLRSVLERMQPHLIDPTTGTAAVSASVVRGFLRAETFAHGARSLEAIVGMSALAGARYFGVTELPSPDLLRLHVTPDFMQRVQEGELEEATSERLAAASHEAWRQDRAGAGWTWGATRSDEARTHPLLVAYHDLPEADKERNRHQARVTLAKLHQIGYRVAPVPPAERHGDAPPRLTADERRRLVAIEHERWLREHLLRGYAHGPVTDERRRLHRDIVPFDQQPAEDKQLSEAAVDSLPAALWHAGYRLVKATADVGRVRLGITGHRILMDTEHIAAGVREALARVQAVYGDRPLTLLSPLAEGADRIVAEAVLRLPGGHLTVVLPFAVEDYATDYGPPGSPSRIHFEALLARAAEVVRLPPVASREEGYAQAGRYVVDHCDVLLAVWDGQPAQGEGGTGEVVPRAQAQGKPVIIVRAGNRQPGTQEPTTLGAEQGQVVAERLMP